MRKLIIGFVAAIAAAGSFGDNIPSGYTPLEYIVGTGSAYLETDYTPNPSQDTIVVDVDLVAGQSGQTIFCARNKETGNDTWTLQYQSDKKLRYDFGTSADRYTSAVAVPEGRHRIVASRTGLWVDGKAMIFDKEFKTAEFTPAGSIWLFAMPWNGATNYSSMKFRSFVILRDNVAVRAYMPIKDADGRATVCDVVGDSSVTQIGTFGAGQEGTWSSSVFSVSNIAQIRYAGPGKTTPLTVKVVDAITGDALTEGVDYSLPSAIHVGYVQLPVSGKGKYCGFVPVERVAVLAKLPAGYTQVEYIESTGEEYIDLDLHPTGKTSFYMDFDLLKQKGDESFPSPFGARAEGTQSRITMGLSAWQFGYYWESSYVCTFNQVGYGTHIVEFVPAEYFLRLDVEQTPLNVSQSLAVNANAYLFAFNDLKNQQPAAVHLTTMKLFAFALSDAGELKRDFVPCKSDKDVYGLYDLVSERFFGNESQSGGFTGGPAMLPKMGLMIILR